MESLSRRSDLGALGGIGNDSSKTIWKTLQLKKIKSRETHKQGNTVVKSTPKQNISSRNTGMTCEMLKIPDLSKDLFFHAPSL